MGDPKRQRKKYEKPRFPWHTDTLQTDLEIMGLYGLRNKRELWRNRTMVSKLRGGARKLLGVTSIDREKKEKELITSS